MPVSTETFAVVVKAGVVSVGGISLELATDLGPGSTSAGGWVGDAPGVGAVSAAGTETVPTGMFSATVGVLV